MGRSHWSTLSVLATLLLLLFLVGAAKADTMEWSVPTANMKWYDKSATDDNAIFSLNGENVTKTSLATGALLWNQPLSPASSGMSLIVDGGATIVVLFSNNFVGTKVYQMYGLCRESGAVLWETTVRPTNNTGPLELSGLVQSGVVSATWTTGTLAPGGRMVEIQVFNATTGALMWNHLPEVRKPMIPPTSEVEYVFAQHSNNGLMFKVDFQVTTFTLKMLFRCTTFLDALTGNTLLLLNGTRSNLVSNMAAGSPFIAQLVEAAAPPSVSFLQNGVLCGDGCVVHVHDAVKSIVQWSRDLGINPAKALTSSNFTLITTDDMLLVAFFPSSAQNGQKWLAAFDIQTSVPLWNVTLPQSVTVVQQQYTMNGDYVVLAFGGPDPATPKDVAAPQIVAFHRRTGERGWTINAPILRGSPYIFRATAAIDGKNDDGLVIPNIMGWTRWAVDNQTQAPTLQFKTVAEVNGVERIIAAPNSTTDYIVFSAKTAARFNQSP